MRSFALFIALILSLPVAALAGNSTVQAPPQSPTMRGLVLDSNGAIIPNAERIHPGSLGRRIQDHPF